MDDFLADLLDINLIDLEVQSPDPSGTRSHGATCVNTWPALPPPPPPYEVLNSPDVPTEDLGEKILNALPSTVQLPPLTSGHSVPQELISILPAESQERVVHAFSREYELFLAGAASCHVQALPTPAPIPAQPHFSSSFISEQYLSQLAPEEDDRPKRPLNSFILWSNFERRRRAFDFSGIPASHASGSLRDAWNALDPAQKLPWKLKSQELFAKFRRDHPHVPYQPAKIKRTGRGARKLGRRPPPNTLGFFSKWTPEPDESRIRALPPCPRVEPLKR
eukprot:m.6174 g.6174  ORF g.6174 m.6174 type:complete len:278 (-) comp3805_c0_seq2:9-842(-)